MQEIRQVTTQFLLCLMLSGFGLSDLQFGKSRTPPPGVDSSAQLRSVIMPRIFGGGQVEKPLKTGSEPYQRQRYYKPSTNNTLQSDCPLSPYATYLSEEDQADLYILVKGARDDGVNEADIKVLMEEYAKNSMSPKRFVQFQKDNQRFEARMERLKRQRRATANRARLFVKERPKSEKLKTKRQLLDTLTSPNLNVEKSKLKRHPV